MKGSGRDGVACSGESPIDDCPGRTRRHYVGSEEPGLERVTIARHPDGKPDIGGAWSGKAQAIEQHLGGTEKNGDAESYPLTLSIVQTGADITVDVTIMRDEGPLAYRLVGKVGRGRFWGQGTDSGGTGNALVAVGGANAKGNVLKGTELLLFDPPIQVKFKAKKQ